MADPVLSSAVAVADVEIEAPALPPWPTPQCSTQGAIAEGLAVNKIGDAKTDETFPVDNVVSSSKDYEQQQTNVVVNDDLIGETLEAATNDSQNNDEDDGDCDDDDDDAAQENQGSEYENEGDDSDCNENETSAAGSAGSESDSEKLGDESSSPRRHQERVFVHDTTTLQTSIVYIALKQRGTLGFKTEESSLGNLRVKEVAPGKQGESCGLKVGDIVLSAKVQANGEKYSSLQWTANIMPHYVFYSLLMSKRRPIILEIQREGNEEEDARMFNSQWSSLQRERSQDPQTSTAKKRGPKRKRMSLEGERPDVNKLRRWREDLMHAFELRVAADEIEAASLASGGNKGVDSNNITEANLAEGDNKNNITNNGLAMGILALQKQKAQIEAMREEIESLWNHPDHGEWEDHFKTLLQFRHDHGHFQITSTNTPNEAFFAWVQNLRENMRKRDRGSKSIKIRETTAMGEDILNKIG
jgi:hypothetical protein